MGSRTSKWVSGIGAVVLIGGLVLANYGGGVPSAAAGGNNGNGQMQCNREGTSCWPVLNGNGGNQNHGNPPPPPQANPFTQILTKLDEILAAIGGIGGGGDGNHTLRWDQNLPAAQRFVVLAAFANAAVLDKETGLVWEQSPATTTHGWETARNVCTARTTGGRKGWRLPSVHEQASLVDPSVTPGPTLPALPPGHPFTNVRSHGYLSATTMAVDPSQAWVVDFLSGSVVTQTKATFGGYAWCVRGGMNADQY